MLLSVINYFILLFQKKIIKNLKKPHNAPKPKEPHKGLRIKFLLR